MNEKNENITKDKIVALRLTAFDIYESNYIYQYGEVDNKYFERCTDLFNYVVFDLKNDLDKSDNPTEIINRLRKKREMLLRIRKFTEMKEANIAGTIIARGKPYNIYMYSNILSSIQQYIIGVGDVLKPHSSWITQLALFNTFLKIADKREDKIFDEEDNIKREKLNDFDKFDIIEKVAALFKNEDLNAEKIDKIKEIIYQ